MGTNSTVAQADILIAGGGLVGASLAAALAQDAQCRDLRIVVVEPGPAPELFAGSSFDPRVVALTRRSQSLLESLRAWPHIHARRACPYTNMRVWDGEGTGTIHFSAHELHEPNLGHIVENSVVLQSLLDVLSALPQVSILRGRKVTALSLDPVAVTLDDGRRFQPSLVIAADGANSPLREFAGIEVKEKSFDQRAIVTTVRTAKSHEHCAWQRFMSTGPLAFLPLESRLEEDSEQHYSSIVWSLDEFEVQEKLALDDQAFAQSVTAAFEGRLGEVLEVAPRFSFPLRQIHAEDYYLPGFALVGDAAHSIHPLAGQGVNLGLLDVEALVAELARARQRRLPLGHPSVLARYQRARRGENMAVMALMDGFKQLFGSHNPGLHLLRNFGMSQLDNLPRLKNALARRAMGL